MTIPEQARQGVKASSACHWRFWKNTELNLQAAEQCLDRLEQMEPSPAQAAVLQMARAAAPPEANPGNRLEVLAQAMETLTGRVAGDLSGLAAVALTLRDQSDPALRPQIEQKLAECLPDAGVLGKVSPEPGWLLTHAARPEPRGGQQWAEALQDCPRASVQKALAELASDETRVWLKELAQFPQLEMLERSALAVFDQNLPVHRWALALPADQESKAELARWALARSPEHPWKTLAGLLPEVERTALERLDQPLDTREAAHLLRELPQAAASLATVCPEDRALALVARLPRPEKGLENYAAGKTTPARLLQSMLGTVPPEMVLANIETSHPLLQEVIASPWSRPEEHARMAVAGWCATEQAGATTAGIGLAMARATDDLNEKLWAVRSTLKASDCPAREAFLELTELTGPNQTWSQAALGLGALRALEKNPQADLREVAQVVLEASTTWAGPAWRQAMAGAVSAELGASSNVVAQALAKQLSQNPDRKALLDLAQVLDDRILSQPTSEAAIVERGNHILVGGVRVDRRDGEAPVTELEPSESSAAAPSRSLTLDPPPAAGLKVEGEWRESYKSGLGGVYNPTSGQMEWKESYKSGVAGAYNPETGEVEWKESYKSGLGVVRKRDGSLEWKESYKSGVVGSENADGSLDWAESYHSGMGQCQHPDGSWERKDSYKSGVAGLWDEEKQAVDWHESYKSGIAYATSHPEKPTLITTASTYGYHEDDD